MFGFLKNVVSVVASNVRKVGASAQRGYASVKAMIVTGVGTGLALLLPKAFAAVPADVSTALTDAKADGLVVAGLVLVAVIAMYAFKLMRRGL